jgi:hypothetical protein
MASTPPLSVPNLPAPPTGGTRAGDTTGFTNLAAGLDAALRKVTEAATSLVTNELHATSTPWGQVLSFESGLVGSVNWATCLSWGPWRALAFSAVTRTTMMFGNGQPQWAATGLVRITNPAFYLPVLRMYLPIQVTACPAGAGGVFLAGQAVMSGTTQLLSIQACSVTTISYPVPTTLEFAHLYCADTGAAPITPL